MTSPNTSATGGVLQPEVNSPPLEGSALQVFLQNWIAPLTTLEPSLVRPRWQPEPSNIPDVAVAWCAVGPAERRSDTFPYVAQLPDNGGAVLQRQEELPVLCSFYDLGATGDADYYATLTRDNMIIPQNQEFLRANGFALAYTGVLTIAPTLKSTRWLMRVDLPVTLRRQIDRTYRILTVESAQVNVTTSDGLDFEVDVEAGDNS